MPYSIDFEHRIAGKSPEATFGIIVAWLQQQDAKVKSSVPPAHIEATHGRALQPMGWRKDARKTLVFDLRPEGADVLVYVKVIPPVLNASDVQSRPDEARANWDELLAELWERMGEAGAVREAILRPGVDWEASLRNGRSMVTAGLVLTVLGIVVSIALSLILPNLYIVATGLIVIGVLSIMYGWMTVRGAKRHLARQRGQPGQGVG